MSLLLQLPVEIRQQILDLVLGKNNLLHIQDRTFAGVKIHRHAICKAQKSEQEAYEEYISSYRNVPPNDSERFYSMTCQERHRDCEVCGEKGNGQDVEVVDGEWVLPSRDAATIDVSLLHVCRQLYEEGTHSLWTTNTFSFDDHESFGNFFRKMHSVQKAKLAKLHILVCYTHHHNEWTNIVTAPLLQELHGLRTIHLCFDQNLGSRKLIRKLQDINPDTMNPVSRFDVHTLEDYYTIQPFGLLQMLPLQHATVVVADSLDDRTNHGPWRVLIRQVRWPLSKKREVAEHLRHILLNHDEAESGK